MYVLSGAITQQRTSSQTLGYDAPFSVFPVTELDADPVR